MSAPHGRPGLGERLFRAASGAFPTAFRRRHRDEMLLDFRRERARIRGELGALGAAAFVARASWDALRQGLRERVRRGPPRGHGGRRLGPGGGPGAGIGTDVRLAVRALGRAPGFTLAAVAVLALGIGANTTVFSALRVVVLAPPPYPEPERLVFAPMTQEHRGRGETRLVSWSYPIFRTFLEAENRLIDPVAGYASRTVTLTEGGPATRVALELVSPSYFDALGVRPVVGRAFRPDEDGLSEPALVAVLSHELWRGRFRGDPAVLGGDVVVGGHRLRVVGVAPRGFRGLTGTAQLWVPIGSAAELVSPSMIEQSGFHWFHVVGRLRPDASHEEARDQMTAIGARLAEAYPSGDPQSVWSATATPFEDVRVNEGARAAVVLLSAAALLVLLVACANLSGLLLARARRRARDGAVRVALGASRWRIVRGALVESLLVSGLGGIVGLGVAVWGTRALAAAWPRSFLRSAEGEMQVVDLSHLGLEPAVLAFALAATGLAALLFGAAPALRVSGQDVSGVLRNGSGATRREGRMLGLDARAALVGAQVAFALVLLIGAGLVGSSTARLLDVEMGFGVENVLTFGYSIPESSTWAARRGQFHDELMAGLGALQGVESVSSGMPPLSGHWAITRVDQVEGGAEIPQGEGVVIGVQMVGDDYFETLGVPVLQGRVFDGRDGLDRIPTIVVGESTAQELFPGVDPIGRRIRIGIADDEKEDFSEVIGVVGDVLYAPPDQPRMLETYYSVREFGSTPGGMLVHTSGPPERLVPAVRDVTARLDPTVAIYGVRTLEEIVAQSVGDRRVVLVLLGLFALVAVLLAATGTWGIVAVSVAERRRELGLRRALGAPDRRVLTMVLRQSVATAILGSLTGVLAGGLGSRLLEAFLWETERLDPAVFLGGAGLLMGVVLVASWLPARRALRLDPAETLRIE